MAKGLLFASFDFTSAHADEFHDWYDLEHIPERLRVPGFINAERWIGDENPNIAVATYDLESLGVLQSAPYKAVGYENASVWTKRVTAMAHRIMRFTGEQLVPGDLAAPSGAGALLVASMNVDPAAEPEFNEWYNAEHLPQLGAVPGVLCARRYSSSAADRERKYLALYHMTGPDVPNGDAWNQGNRMKVNSSGFPVIASSPRPAVADPPGIETAVVVPCASGVRSSFPRKAGTQPLLITCVRPGFPLARE